MKATPTFQVSRRHFIKSTVLASTGVWLLRRRMVAAAESPVVTIRNAATTAKITATKLCGNVCVFQGSGGNITALTDGDGKLLVDAGIPGSRPRITEAWRVLAMIQ